MERGRSNYGTYISPPPNGLSHQAQMKRVKAQEEKRQENVDRYDKVFLTRLRPSEGCQSYGCA
jgi:hypothetical protein